MPTILSHFPPGSNEPFSVIVIIFPSKPAGPWYLMKLAMETHDFRTNHEFRPLSTTAHTKFTEYCQQTYLKGIVALSHQCTQSIAASFLNCITPPPTIKSTKKKQKKLYYV